MNPVSYARYLANISTTALSKRLGVSKQYIVRLEQGLYDKPGKVLLDWTVSTINRNVPVDKHVTSAGVEQLYKEWQWQRRESCKIDRALRPLEVTEYDRVIQRSQNQHPELFYYHKVFYQWRTAYWSTSHAFCVDMCLHPSPVVDYEEGNTQTMPNNLKKIMGQMGLIGQGFKTNES